MLSNTVISYIRTYVPLLVGFLVTWAQPFGLTIDTEAATALCVTLVTAAYYALARILEKRWPKFGWLLGAPKQPAYSDAPVPDHQIVAADAPPAPEDGPKP